MPVSTFQQTDFQNQSVEFWEKNIDGNTRVQSRISASFAPHANTPFDMTVVLDAGHLFDGTILKEISQQTISISNKPNLDSRIDRIVVDAKSGLGSVITGTEAPSPTPPEITEGKIPVAQILLHSSSTHIINEMIVDERDFSLLGLGSSATKNLSQSIVDAGKGKLEIAYPTSLKEGTSHSFNEDDRGFIIQRSNSGSLMLDTLPIASSQNIQKGWGAIIQNTDTTSILVVSVENGESIKGSHFGYITLGPGQSSMLSFDGINYSASLNPERVLINSNLSFYISNVGADTNSGLHPNSPLATIQKAIDIISRTYNLNGQTITIQIADGTYNGFSSLIPWTGGGYSQLIISGNPSSPANVLITSGTTTCLGEGAGTGFTIQNVKIQSNNGYCLMARSFSEIKISNIVFGSATKAHIAASINGLIIGSGNYNVSGNAAQHISCNHAGGFVFGPGTVTINGTPSFSTAFCHAYICGYVNVNGTSYVGSATGTRYISDGNSLIFTNGAGPTYFPGSMNGYTSLGGQYG